MRRLVVCLLAVTGASLGAVPAAAGGAEPPAAANAEPMPWSVLSRFGGDADGDGRLDGEPVPGVAESSDLNAFVVRVHPSAPTCEAIGDGKPVGWRVDGAAVEGVEITRGNRCFADLAVRGQGEHTILVAGDGRAERAATTVEDTLVVALGDSVASGEGNPEGTRPGKWLDPPCHRSSLAGFEQTARMFAQQLERDGPPGSVTFVSLACSGAEIGAGLLGSQRKVSRRDPQATRLERLASARQPRSDGDPPVDAVLVSIGGNDIGFSGVVRNCALPGSCAKRLGGKMAGRLEDLSGQLDRLRLKLGTAAPGSPVLISEYFDPTRDERGEFCAKGLGWMNQAKARWAYEEVLAPLNATIEAAATGADGWRYVGGIATDFRAHGYCVDEPRRWVRTLGESFGGQLNHRGTMHPNRPGHEAIAGRVAPALAATLGLSTPDPVAEEGEAGTDWELLGWIAVAPFLPALFLGLVVLAGWLVLRVLRLLLPTWHNDPLPTPEGPEPLEGGPGQGSRRVPWLALLGGAGLLGLLLLSELTGRLIILARFWSANLPPTQAADAVGAGELAMRGSGAIGLFVALGLAAVAVAWLLDNEGSRARGSRRGLVVIGLAELALAIQLGDFPPDQKIQLFAGLGLAALLLYFLVERTLERAGKVEENAQPGEARTKAAWTQFKAWAARLGAAIAADPLLALYRAIPFVLLAYAVFRACGADGPDRVLLVTVPYLAAVLLFALPGSLASPAMGRGDPDSASLGAPRIALAAAGLACILILLVRDEWWLAASAAIATVLGLFCLAVAATPPRRFAPYGIAIFVTMLAFGAATSVLRGIDSPELQPAAALLKDGGSVCGAYIGESDGRLWLGRLRLDDRADVRRPRPGAIFSIDSERVSATAIGPLTPVARVETRAAEMRTAMLAEDGREDPRRGLPSCRRRPAETPTVAALDRGELKEVTEEADLMRDLARSYQPELVIDRRDGFWPIPVRTLFSMQDRRASICRQVAVERSGCLRLRSPADLPWTGDRGENLEYPAANDDRGEQHDLMVDALGSADPARTSLIYYLVSRPEGKDKPITIQYWFFYSFNYQPIPGIGGGYHEGDFESVAILFSGREHRPRHVWMARHGKGEGRLFAWEDPALAKVGDHPQIFVARGSHASYESCDRQRRSAAPRGILDDYPACDAGRPLRLAPETTPLADLSRAGWACWEGLFGHASEGIYKQTHLIGDAPRSPLWQQDLGDEPRHPCRGIRDPGGRHGPDEEAVAESSGVPAKLRAGSSDLVPMVDSCEDWRRPAASGTYIVVCDPSALKTYLGRGFEGASAWGVGIRADDPNAADPAPQIPAQRQDPTGRYLEDWRIVAESPATASVFASCPYNAKKRGIAWVEFHGVNLVPGRPLRLFDRGQSGEWTLAGPNGEPVAKARPFATEVKGGQLVIPSLPSEAELSCGA